MIWTHIFCLKKKIEGKNIFSSVIFKWNGHSAREWWLFQNCISLDKGYISYSNLPMCFETVITPQWFASSKPNFINICNFTGLWRHPMLHDLDLIFKVIWPTSYLVTFCIDKGYHLLLYCELVVWNCNYSPVIWVK